MQRINNNIILLLGFLSVSFFCQGQTNRSLQKITDQTLAYNASFPKQKIYLHTDKDTYFDNEKIWIRAYVNSGLNSTLDTLSKNLYVELWSPSNVRVNIIRLKLKNGMANGSFSLIDTLEQGVYQLRAFTEILLNDTPEFYFNKNIIYYNSNHQFIISPEEARKNRKKLKKYYQEKTDFEVLLTFEQNAPLLNNPVRFYFKAMNKHGELIPVKGYITSSKSGKVESFKSIYPGVGKVNYTPLLNHRYKVVFISDNGIKKVYALPEAVKTGLTGSVEHHEDDIAIALSKPTKISNDPTANRYIVIGHANNIIYYTSVVDLRSDTVLKVPSSRLPPGIAGVTVFTSRLSPVSNYQIYNFPKSTKQIYDVSSSLLKDSVKLSFKVNDLLLRCTSLSIIVSDTQYISRNNYVKNYYLNSDLEGNPDHNILLNSNPDKAYLQCLIKSSRITSPDWEKVFSDMSKNQEYSPEKGIVVQGRIVTEIFSLPLKEASVNLEILDRYNDIYSTTTNDKGYFGFEGFDFYDTLKMRIIARKHSGRKNLQIELAYFESPELKEYYGSNFLTTTSMRDQKVHRTKMARISKERFRKEEKELEEFYKDIIHGRPDFILYGNELNDNLTVLQAIVGRVPGVQVTGDRIIIRGINTIMGSTDPLVLVDDVPTHISILSSIYVRDVDRIEFLKGPSASIYGIRGANGVIAVYTKRGEFMIKGQIEFELIGYHNPDNFLQEIFNQPENEIDNLPKTLLWIPSVNIFNKESFVLKLRKPEKGDFIHVILEGINSEHKPFSEAFTFTLN